jgi:N-acetylglutamate synthase-like GNAT family acetyltransferase
MWWVAVNRDERVIGAIGVEPGQHAWLLRSTVVDETVRQQGTSKALVTTVEAAAQGAGVGTLFCFGTDVGDYWERRGFVVVPVDEICQHVPHAPQIGQFVANGWLVDEVAWRKDL